MDKSLIENMCRNNTLSRFPNPSDRKIFRLRNLNLDRFQGGIVRVGSRATLASGYSLVKMSSSKSLKDFPNR